MQTVSQGILDTVRGQFNFSVDKFPLSGPDNMRTPWYGLFRSDTLVTVGNGSVTDRYVPHTTDDVLAMVEAASEAFDGIGKVQCYFNHGHYVTIEPSKDERREIFGKHDNIFPRVIIRAGYDGRCFSAMMGYYRDLCMNLARMSQVSGTNVSIKHTSGLRPKMDELIRQFGLLKGSWEQLAARIVEMQAAQVNMVEFLKTVYGEPETDSQRSVTIHKNRTEAIFQRLSNERLRSNRGRLTNDWMVSKWEAFNAVQGYVQHEATRKGANRNGLDIARAMQAMNDPAVSRAELALAA
jgi:hypothetical protein